MFNLPEWVIDFFRVFISFFIITDSIGNLPFFIGLTEGETKQERRNTFNTALITGAALLAVFVFAGSLLFSLFDLTMAEVRIAGGILLLLIAIELMLRGKVIAEHKEDVGVVPLGSPLLIGPGAITTALVSLQMYNYWVVVAALVVCFGAIWLVLQFAEQIYNFLGHNGALIVTKIAAILIAAIAVQFMTRGLLALFVK
jgi:multiple antibiotic resistance protein